MVFRYRLIDADSTSDLGPLVSSRAAFEVGEVLWRGSAERFELREIVAAENENFRAYLVVAPLDVSGPASGQSPDPSDEELIDFARTILSQRSGHLLPDENDLRAVVLEAREEWLLMYHAGRPEDR